MGAIHYEVVQKDGDFKRYDSLDDIKHLGDYFFIVQKEEGYHCATYSHFKAQVIDPEGNFSKADYHGYEFRHFEITGNAGEYLLKLSFQLPQGGGYKERTFREDISFNHYYEDYKSTKPEWDITTQYKDIFDYFDNLDKYGVDAYERIIELERDAFRQHALYERSQFDYESYKKHIDSLMKCVKELYVPKEVEYIWISHRSVFSLELFDSVERIFLPASLKQIESLSFSGDKNLKQVFCMAETPPKISFSHPYGPETELYVPKCSMQAYKDDESWSKSFPVIKGF